ncbi:splicing factor 45-like [Watersipora subatra]|uniref:splicing factor 45-like n=1 Tax=Watersipora subatra TaxID=2589382 RepID=UPI00355B479A
MSLYDDIDLDKKDLGDTKSDVSGWSVGHRLLHSHSANKKSSGLSGSSYTKKRPTSSLTPVVDLNSGGGYSGVGGGSGGGSSLASQDGEIRFNHITGKLEAGGSNRSYAQLGVKTYPSSSPFADMSQEYDPGFPNEYADFSKRLKRLRNEEREREEREKETERRKDSEERQRKRDEERKEKLEKIAASFQPPTNLYKEAAKETESTKRLALYDSSSDSDEDERDKYKGSNVFAPPPSLIEESKPMTPPPNPFIPNISEDPDNPSGFKIEGKGGSVASKIMARMGYKQGSGLGREEQGMSIALQVEKTSRRGGKILHEKDIASKEMASTGAPIKADTGISHTELLRNPSKVLLLTNMVGPGEVDDELEAETAEECAKYGKVTKCIIYELKDVPEILAVRIFVEFDKITFAIKAAVDLNGRFFGGRVVRAAFYSHEKFLKMKLDDDPQ